LEQEPLERIDFVEFHFAWQSEGVWDIMKY